MMQLFWTAIALVLICGGSAYVGSAFAFKHGIEHMRRHTAKMVIQEEERRIKRTKF